VGRFSRTVRAALPIAALALAPAVAPAQGPPHPMGPGSAPPQHAAAPLPFYRERTFLVLVGLAAAGSGALAYRVVQRRRRTPAGFVSEAVLVVDLVDSTHLATHHGESVAMRARNALKDRTLVAARRHGMVFAENTGDGYFMTLPSVSAAARTALELLEKLGTSKNIGYNANTGEYVDMFKAGIVDPAKVARTALQMAASVAGLMLTTNVLVTELKEEDEQEPVPGSVR